jgi:hypothetical protein
MRVVVAVAGSRIPRLVAMVGDGISTMVSIAAVTARDSHGCHHHQNAGGGFV